MIMIHRIFSIAVIVFAILNFFEGFPLLAEDINGSKPLLIIDEKGDAIGEYKESHALVIGVSDYTNGWRDLPGVKKDVEAVRSALKKKGFNVRVVMDPDKKRLQEAFELFIRDYGGKSKSSNRLLFYFAGHGYSIKPNYARSDKIGYIIPSEAPNPLKSDKDMNDFINIAMSMHRIEEFAEKISAKHAIFLFDSCFSGSLFKILRGPLLGSHNISYKIANPIRQFITSGRENEEVPDESIFRRQFISALEGEADFNMDGFVTGCELGLFLEDRVINYSKGAQHPVSAKIRNPDLDKGDFIFKVKSIIPSYSSSSPPPPLPPPPKNMKLIKGRCFKMRDVHGGGDLDHRPEHEICVDDFFIGVYEVTVGDFSEFVEDTHYITDAERQGWGTVLDSSGNEAVQQEEANWRNPGFFQDEKHPVVMVSWNDANEYIEWLGRKDGVKYRLPTEAEWEFAARSRGKEYEYSWGDGNPSGNIAGEEIKDKFPNSRLSILDGYVDEFVFTAQVGSFEKNKSGLFDMTGNVSEWCSDWYSNDYHNNNSPKENPHGPSAGEERVVRGGSWINGPRLIHVSYRDKDDPEYCDTTIGFRLVISAQ